MPSDEIWYLDAQWDHTQASEGFTHWNGGNYLGRADRIGSRYFYKDVVWRKQKNGA